MKQLSPLVWPDSGQPQAPPMDLQYEWVDVGMFEYDPQTKLYLVKRVFVPDNVAQKDGACSSTHNLGSAGSSEGSSDAEDNGTSSTGNGSHEGEGESSTIPARQQVKVTKKRSKKKVQQKLKGKTSTVVHV